jgi:hypothetical protein
VNKKQRILSFVVLGVFSLTVLFAPWIIVTRRSGAAIYSMTTCYQPVFLVPDVRRLGGFEARLAWQPLLSAWLALGIAHGSLFFLLRTPKSIELDNG